MYLRKLTFLLLRTDEGFTKHFHSFSQGDMGAADEGKTSFPFALLLEEMLIILHDA